MSQKGNHYYLFIVDDFTKFIWLFPIAIKNLVSSILQSFITFITKHFSTSIMSIQTDGGKEFKPLKTFFQQNGIVHRLTCPYSHQQNGSIETHHWRIIDMGLTFLKYASLLLHFWDFSFETSAYLTNRLPTPILQNKSPFETLF